MGGDWDSMQAPLVAVDLAERRQYAALTQALAVQPRLARVTDDFGMTPLHWVCSDADVPLPVLRRVVLAHPPATAARNLAGLLPLHLAVRKRLPLEALHALLEVYAAAVVAATPDGKRPARLAREAGADRETVDCLVALEGEVCGLAQRTHGRASAALFRASDCLNRSSGEESDGVGDYGRAVDEFDEGGELATGAISYRDDDQMLDGGADRPSRASGANAMAIDPVTALMASTKTNQSFSSSLSLSLSLTPPEWKHASTCRICDVRFGYLRGRRHHCRNCGDSVCGRHSRHAVPLKHLGLSTAQRVCSACFERIQQLYTARALARVAPLERLGGFTVPITPMTASSPLLSKFQRSRSVLDELSAVTTTAPCCASLASSPLLPGDARAGYTPSFPTFGATPMQDVDSIHIARVRRRNPIGAFVQDAVAAVAPPPGKARQRVRKERVSVSTADRSLAITELTAHSGAWHEFEADAAGAPGASASVGDSSALSRAAAPASAPGLSSGRRLKASLDSQVLELEAQMERLLAARRRISVALKNSQLQVARARREKHELDEAARKFRDLGYPSDSEDDQYCSVGRDNQDEDGVHVDALEHGDSCRLKLSGSSASTTAAATSIATSDNEYEDAPHDNARYCDDSLEESSTDDDGDDSSSTSKHSAQTLLLPLRQPRRRLHRRPPTPRLAPALSDSHRCLQSMEPPTLDVAATHADLGSALLASGRSSAAAAAFRDALSLDADKADVWHQLATALDAAGDRPQEAEEAARRAVERQPSSLASLSLLGKLLHARGEHEEAIRVFRRALELQKL